MILLTTNLKGILNLVGKVKTTSAAKYNDKGEQIEFSNTTITKDSTTTKVTKSIYDTHDDKATGPNVQNWMRKVKQQKLLSGFTAVERKRQRSN